MSAMAERHHDLITAAEPFPRYTVAHWHELILRCALPAWRRSAVRLTFTEMYAIVDATLREAAPDSYPETVP